MKTRFLLAASLFFAIGMTGCSNSLDDDNPATGKDDKVLIVRLPDTSKLTRGVEDQVAGTETGLEDVTVFLMNGQRVDSAVELSSEEITAKSKRFEQVSYQVDRVIVVANKVGEDTNVLSLTTADAIRNYAYTVASQHNGTGLDNRTLIGEAIPETATNTEDEHEYKLAEVTLNAITARLEIGAVKKGEGVESVTLVAVYVNNFFEEYNAASAQLYDESDLIWNVTVGQTDPLPNVASKDPITSISTGDYVPAEYKTVGDDNVSLTKDSKVYAFHVFPGNIPHIIMLVNVTLEDGYYEKDEDGNALKHKYGYVTFTKFNTGNAAPNNYVKAMEAHNIYKMGVGTTGIKIDAKDITDTPEKGPYDLGIDVIIAPWTVNEVTPEV